MKIPIQFTLNSEPRAEFVEEGATLLALLREKAGVSSPKAGCLQGSCGCCTVLIDGAPYLSCLVLAQNCTAKSIETVEGLAQGTAYHPLQQAFMEHFAAQCGFCTSGMLMAAKALLDRNNSPTRDDVIDAISGNVCRCTGYLPIIEAILSAAAIAAGRARGGRADEV